MGNNSKMYVQPIVGQEHYLHKKITHYAMLFPIFAINSLLPQGSHMGEGEEFNNKKRYVSFLS